MKNYTTYKAIRLLAAIFMFAGSTYSVQGQVAICEGDSICFDANTFAGSIQWQSSPDNITFADINAATTNPWCGVPPAGDHFVRGVITNGTCDTIYSDTLYALVSPVQTLSVVNDTLLINTSCLDTIGLNWGNFVHGGGTAPFMWSWGPTGNLNNPNSQTPIFISPGVSGYYVFTGTVTDDAGCMVSEDVTVFVDPHGNETFNFTGGIQTFTAPACIDTIFVQVWGAQGGSGATGGLGVLGGAGGLGGYAEGWLAVTPGDVLNVFVGGQGATPTGGFNGGGNAGTVNGGGGGGSSDVRVGGTAEADRVITGGGGGGGGRGGCDEGGANTGGLGGAGGGGGSGLAGTNGGDSPTSGGFAGGGKGGNFGPVQGASGPAGIGCAGFLGAPGGTAATGTGAAGGAGQTCCCSAQQSIPGGGGGGGGQIGGGGGGGGSAGTTGCSGNSKGAGGGGGGGSSFTGGVLNGVTNQGIWLGNGQVSISW